MADRGFEDLDCYKLALEVLVEAYAVARRLPAVERYNLCDQLRRAATSATLNIAEGYGRYHYLDKARFYYIARGSLTESLAAFLACQAAGYTDEAQLQRQRELCHRALQALNGLIRYTNSRKQGQREYGDRALRDAAVGYHILPSQEPGFPSSESTDPESTTSQEETMDLYGKDFIVSQEWAKPELDELLDLAAKMKRDRFSPRWTSILQHKTFFMFFYNPSVRTRQSFECAATELGGHAQFLEPKAMRLKTATTAGETIEDAAKVMARYACGLGIRILEDKVPHYGAGNELLREYAHWADIPILNMADDRFHPCQGMADVMGWAEWYGEGPGRANYEKLEGKNFLLTWASGALARSWCSVQEALLVASRFGMNVTIARPEGYDLDPEVYAWTHANCEANSREFCVVDDPETGYDGAHVVYSRNWVTAGAYQDGEFQKQAEIDKAMAHPGWTTTAERMARTDNAIFTHPMPIDRGSEVTDEVASGPRSAIYDVAENRLHVQKAAMALTMGNL